MTTIPPRRLLVAAVTVTVATLLLFGLLASLGCGSARYAATPDDVRADHWRTGASVAWGADVGITLLALDRGYSESNPILGHHDRGPLLAVSAALYGLTWWIGEQLPARHRLWLWRVVGVGHALAVGWNGAILAQDREHCQ